MLEMQESTSSSTQSTLQCLFTSVLSQMTELMQNMEKLWKMDILPYRSRKLAMKSKQDKEAL